MNIFGRFGSNYCRVEYSIVFDPDSLSEKRLSVKFKLLVDFSIAALL